MYDEIIFLFYQGFSECQIAAELGIHYAEVMEVLDNWFFPWWYDDEFDNLY